MYKLLTGGALAVAAVHCAALTVSGPQGSVYIGRPLDVRIVSKIDADDSVENLCLKADVQYGDEHLPDRQVEVTLSPAEDGRGTLRVHSTRVVNEPIVSLTIQSGCHSSVFRRTFTLLADLDPQVVSTVAPVLPTAVTKPAGQQPSGSASVASTSASPTTQRPAVRREQVHKPALVGKTKVKPSARKAKQLNKPRSSAVDAKASPQSVPAKTGARLKLEPIDLSPAVSASTPVAPSNAPVSAPVAPAQGSAGQPGGSPEGGTSVGVGGATPDATGALLKELQSMRVEQEKMRADMLTLQSRLAQAQQTGGSSSTLVYGLLVLVAFLGGALFWLKRQRDEALKHTAGPIQWSERLTDESPSSPVTTPEPWADSVAGAGSGLVVSEVPTMQSEFATSTLSSGWSSSVSPEDTSAQSATSTSTEKDLSGPVSSLDWPHTSTTQQPDLVMTETQVSPETSVSPQGGLSITLAELADAWEQVDFLESIGQTTEAMSMLERFAQQHPRACEGFYLRWLHLAQTQNDWAGMAQASQLYEQHYQRFVPLSVQSNAAGQGLELDVTLAQRLAQAWPSGEVPALLEQALMSTPLDRPVVLSERSLAAFEDLFALHQWWHNLPTGPVSPRLPALLGLS